PLYPPGEMVVYHKHMVHPDVKACANGLELHAIEIAFINAIGYAAAERFRVVVLLDLPYRHGVDRTWQRTVHAARKHPGQGISFREVGKPLRVEIARHV